MLHAYVNAGEYDSHTVLEDAPEEQEAAEMLFDYMHAAHAFNSVERDDDSSEHIDKRTTVEETRDEDTTLGMHDEDAFGAYLDELDGKRGNETTAGTNSVQQWNTSATEGNSIQQGTSDTVDHPWVFSGAVHSNTDQDNLQRSVGEEEVASGGLNAEEYLKAQATAGRKGGDEEQRENMLEGSGTIVQPDQPGAITEAFSDDLNGDTALDREDENVVSDTFAALSIPKDDVRMQREVIMKEHGELFKSLPFYLKAPVAQCALINACISCSYARVHCAPAVLCFEFSARNDICRYCQKWSGRSSR